MVKSPVLMSVKEREEKSIDLNVHLNTRETVPTIPRIAGNNQ